MSPRVSVPAVTAWTIQEVRPRSGEDYAAVSSAIVSTAFFFSACPEPN